MKLAEKVATSTAAIASVWPERPRVGIILGSGLGNFATQIDVAARLPYQRIPHFPCPTALAHRGHLVCGRVADVPVVAMEGRCHLYEGHTATEITLPVRAMRELGVELLIVSNACGGMNPGYNQGDIVIIDDHINLMFKNPLTGPHDDTAGPRFPDMCRPYSPRLIERALDVARRHGFAAHRGVYVGVCGPNLETRAEYRFFRRIGGDVVGMSTVPEVLVAAQLGLPVLGLATVTNVCLPDALRRATAEEIVAAAEAAEPRFRTIVCDAVTQQAARGDEKTTPVSCSQ